MKLTIVGSGTAAPEAERAASAFYLDAAGQRVLVDCGPGAVHNLARFGLPWHRIDHLVITHFHNDHTGDIPALLFGLKWGIAESRFRPFHVWAPAGFDLRRRAMADAFGDHVLDPGFPVHVHEIGPGVVARPAPGLELAAARTPHTEESLAFRFRDARGATLGVTGDTGPSPELARFLAGVDLLLAECSLPDDEALDTHLTPTSLAVMAGAAAPGRLVVTHVYPQLARQDVLGLLNAAGWTGPTIRAEDGLTLAVGPESDERF